MGGCGRRADAESRCAELSELNTLFGSGSLAFGGKLKADVQLQGRLMTAGTDDGGGTIQFLAK
jgi:hypothetical protein